MQYGVLADHALQAAHLALDAPQAALHRFLVVVVAGRGRSRSRVAHTPSRVSRQDGESGADEVHVARLVAPAALPDLELDQLAGLDATLFATLISLVCTNRSSLPWRLMKPNPRRASNHLIEPRATRSSLGAASHGCRACGWRWRVSAVRRSNPFPSWRLCTAVASPALPRPSFAGR